MLDLRNWKLTLPVNTSHEGNPDEIRQPELTGYSKAGVFEVGQGGVVFTTPTNGATTGGSSYPRTELREMANNGTSNASWSSTSGTHSMAITQAITHIPNVKRHLVAGQIHDSGDDLIVIRLEGTDLFVDHNGDHGPTLDTNYQLGTFFKIEFRVANGHVLVFYNDVQRDDLSVSKSGLYFKAGAYPQSNPSKGEPASAYGQVVITNLTVTHT